MSDNEPDNDTDTADDPAKPETQTRRFPQLLAERGALYPAQIRTARNDCLALMSLVRSQYRKHD